MYTVYSFIVAQSSVICIQYTALLSPRALLYVYSIQLYCRPELCYVYRVYSFVVAQRCVTCTKYTALLSPNTLLYVYSIQLCCRPTPCYMYTVYSFVVDQRPVICIQYRALLSTNAILYVYSIQFCCRPPLCYMYTVYSFVVDQRHVICIQYTVLLSTNAILYVYSMQFCCRPPLCYMYTVYSFVVAHRSVICIQYTALLLPTALLYSMCAVYSFVVAQGCHRPIVMLLFPKWFAVLFLCLLRVYYIILYYIIRDMPKYKLRRNIWFASMYSRPSCSLCVSVKFVEISTRVVESSRLELSLLKTSRQFIHSYTLQPSNVTVRSLCPWICTPPTA